MDAAKSMMCRDPRRLLLCGHVVFPMWARVVLLLQAARRYSCKHVAGRGRSEATLLDLR